MDALIVGRAICGLGGAGMYTGVMVLLSLITLEHERPIYFGLTGLTWGPGTILDPVIGGAFTDSTATWRWSFYINLCVGAVCAPIYLSLLPSVDPRAGTNFKSRLVQIDYLGTLIICGTIAAGFMAISFGGTLYAWNIGQIIGLFDTTELQRLFPIQFLRSPVMIMIFLATACASMEIFVQVYFIPLCFQFVPSDAALQAGVRLLPYVVLAVFMAMTNSGVMSKASYYMPWYVFSGIFCLVGSTLMYTVDETTSNAKIYGYNIILGIGTGAFLQLSFTVAQSKVEKHILPIAIGFLTFAQLIGPAVALCITNAVFINEATSGILGLDSNLSVQVVQSATARASSRQIQGISADTQQKALQVIVQAMSKAYIVAMTAGALTLVMALFMKREKLVLGPATSS